MHPGFQQADTTAVLSSVVWGILIVDVQSETGMGTQKRYCMKLSQILGVGVVNGPVIRFLREIGSRIVVVTLYSVISFLGLRVG